MKLKNEQEIKLKAQIFSDEYHPLLRDIDRDKWFTVTESYEEGYTQAQQTLLSQASEGFEEWKNANFERLQQLFRLEFGEEAWQACTLSHAKKMQEKDAEIKRLQKENQEMREALNQAIKILDEGCIVYDQHVPSGASSFRVEADMFIKDVSKCYKLSETPNSSKEGV